MAGISQGTCLPKRESVESVPELPSKQATYIETVRGNATVNCGSFWTKSDCEKPENPCSWDQDLETCNGWLR